MWIAIDDTDSPRTMCTTYLGAVLIRRLLLRGFGFSGAKIIRLNPNVPFKTRGNAAVSLEMEGDPGIAFQLACRCVEDLADLPAEGTEPGVAVSEEKPPVQFYHRALRSFCEKEEAVEILEGVGARYRGWKGGRGLIGAAAAMACDLPDATWELLVYRERSRWGIPREIDRESFFLADSATTPCTWDTVDRENDIVVCSPHTPDPVLFGIRGENPFSVALARTFVRTETPGLEQVFLTNQGTDGHLEDGEIGELIPGYSYRLTGTVAGEAETGRGGHVAIPLDSRGRRLRCMAYEPTKGFRDVVRALRRGDEVEVCGSFKAGSLNLEKVHVLGLAPDLARRAPRCPSCGKGMTSAGREKGFKCRRCGTRTREGEERLLERKIGAGWYEVPPSARRHLAKPLVRLMRHR